MTGWITPKHRANFESVIIMRQFDLFSLNTYSRALEDTIFKERYTKEVCIFQEGHKEIGKY